MGEKIEIGTNKYRVAGIYQIVNLVNQKVYTGSTCCFCNRFKHHKSTLKNGKHGNSYLQKDYDLYGLKAFRFEPIEVLSAEDCEDGETFKEMLKRRERYWAAQINTHDQRYGYNLAPISKGAPMNKETREKMSKVNRGEKSYNSILSAVQVVSICERLIEGERVKDLAKEFKVKSCTISMIKRGKAWAHLTIKYLEPMRSIGITDVKVAEIRNLLHQGAAPKEIAKMYNVSLSTISSIKNNKANFNIYDAPLQYIQNRKKLTDVTKDEIWNLLKQGKKGKEIAEMCNVSPSIVSLIKKRKEAL